MYVLTTVSRSSLVGAWVIFWNRKFCLQWLWKQLNCPCGWFHFWSQLLARVTSRFKSKPGHRSKETGTSGAKSIEYNNLVTSLNISIWYSQSWRHNWPVTWVGTCFDLTIKIWSWPKLLLLFSHWSYQCHGCLLLFNSCCMGFMAGWLGFASHGLSGLYLGTGCQQWKLPQVLRHPAFTLWLSCWNYNESKNVT